MELALLWHRGPRLVPQLSLLYEVYQGGFLPRPVPPGESKHKEVRYLNIHQNDRFDEALMATWVTQSAALPGWAA